jgi:hypothetical protein
MADPKPDDVDEAVEHLHRLYPLATPLQIAERLCRRARVVRALEPRYALQLEARAAQFTRRHELWERQRGFANRTGAP